MRVIITKNYKEMSQVALNYVMGEMSRKKRVNISITAGKTPIEMYKLMVPLVKGKEYYNNVHYYNFDEMSVYLWALYVNIV